MPEPAVSSKPGRRSRRSHRWRRISAAATSLRRLPAGGSAGNEQLTAAIGSLALLLLAIEGATLLNLRSLLTVHAFVGMMIIPVVALKLASTGWRALRYYLRDEQYVSKGPPHLVLRLVVAPITVAATAALLASGVALLALDQTSGTIVGLHKASFIVWIAATSIHVLAHLPSLPAALRRRLPGVMPRLMLLAAGMIGGAVLATATLPAADALQDRASAVVGLDPR